ncbi:MAG: tetratricopeptide repeat protein [Proteobacteria bacterium]|nr:tetratricopeptide repeat protein [Pseudomonadota bacterium]
MRSTVSKYIPTIQVCSFFCFAVIMAVMLSLIPFPVRGEIQTITRTVKEQFGGSRSADDARIAAVARAKREALEKAGVYVESLAVVKDFRVEKDEILALSAGVLKTEVVSEKNYVSGNVKGIEVVVEVVVDTSFLEARVKKLLEDRKHLNDLNQARIKEKEYLDKITKLEVENLRLMAQNKSSDDLKRQFQEASQGLTAVDWFYKASALWQDEKFSNPKKAIEYLNNAIRLKPDFAVAYNNRGVAYSALGQHQHAIEDCNEAVRLEPDDAKAYYNRGLAYLSLGQYQQSITDFNESIRLKPDVAIAYSNRGSAYGKLGQHQRAIQDFNEAIRLKPDYAAAYLNRGNAYHGLGQHQRAIEDFNESIRLKPDNANAYYNRGNAYLKLRQPQRAIEDYNEAIRLNPDDAGAYNNRGYAYLLMGNTTRGCSDAQKACSLGDCKLYELAKRKGDCR